MTLDEAKKALNKIPSLNWINVSSIASALLKDRVGLTEHFEDLTGTDKGTAASAADYLRISPSNNYTTERKPYVVINGVFHIGYWDEGNDEAVFEEVDYIVLSSDKRKFVYYE